MDKYASPDHGDSMIGQRLRQLRQKKGFTLDQLSEISGVNRGTIHRIELDQVSPRLDTLSLVCGALGQDLSGFFNGKPPLQEEQLGTDRNAAAFHGSDEDCEPEGACGLRQGVLDWLEPLEALIQGSADGLAVTDRHGFLIFESRASIHLMYGNEPLRRSQPWYGFAHPEDQPALIVGMQLILAEPRNPQRLEYRLPAGDGQWRWVRSNLQNQLDHPSIQGIVINTHDLTDCKVAEEQRRCIQRLETQIQVMNSNL
jgi:PAS domain S-box-containing protein